MTTREFHIGDILSVTDGRLVSPRHMDGVYDILNYLSGHDLFTHQLPRASNVCKPWILEQHPQLAEPVDKDAELTPENVSEWLAKQIEKFGETLPLLPCPSGYVAQRDPVQELCEIVGPGNVIVVET